MPLQATSGAASYDAFGGGAAAAVPQYIEEVFQTWLYTGNGTSQTITNGVDLAGKGGLVWIKSRTNTSGGATSHALVDSARGIANWLATDAVGGESNFPNLVTAFNASGFSVGNAPFWANENTIPYTSWTFRKQPKFFDVVTYTGDGVNGRQIAHSLGSTPGFVIVKRTDATSNWQVRADAQGYGWNLLLNSTVAGDTATTFENGNISGVSSTTFTVSNGTTNFNNVNTNGGTYVAYLFAHNAGGFGLTGTDNVISCGSFTTDGSGNASVTLGYEPQWVMYKTASATGNWQMADSMRGMIASGENALLRANLSVAEAAAFSGTIAPNATGFSIPSGAVFSTTYIYIAIRRGPMKVPTTGTSVLNLSARTGNANAGAGIGAGFTDLIITKDTAGSAIWAWTDRLRGRILELNSSTANAETAYANDVTGFDRMDGVFLGTGAGGQVNSIGTPYINYLMRRAPGYFDEVCYTGDGGTGTRTINHNLTVPAELLIIKDRSVGGADWMVGSTPLGWTKFLNLNNTNLESTSDVFADTAPTSSVFSVRKASGSVNETNRNFVAYLFATCPGVSKVGGYTGTGTTQTINCGFTGGARFVLIKASSATGGWYVWDSARGIVAGNDPYLLLNSTAAEVTTTDWVDTAASGFELSNAGGNLANSNGVSYIFLAIS